MTTAKEALNNEIQIVNDQMTALEKKIKDLVGPLELELKSLKHRKRSLVDTLMAHNKALRERDRL